MRKKTGLLVLIALSLALGSTVQAQGTATAPWPVCQLGKAPIALGPAPKEAVVFRTTGGPVIMSEAGPRGAERQVRLISCLLAPGTEVYRGADGTLRDLPSNQPFWPVGWDAVPPQQIRSLPGKNGYTPIKGIDYFDGKDGKDGRDGRDGRDAVVFAPEKGGGFCSSKKCRWIVAGVGGAIAAQQLYYWWPCITGNRR